MLYWSFSDIMWFLSIGLVWSFDLEYKRCFVIGIVSSSNKGVIVQENILREVICILGGKNYSSAKSNLNKNKNNKKHSCYMQHQKWVFSACSEINPNTKYMLLVREYVNYVILQKLSTTDRQWCIIVMECCKIRRNRSPKNYEWYMEICLMI